MQLYIIAYWLLHNVPHELRIKWYGPSCTQTASTPYLVIPKSPQFHDVGISTNPVLGRDINASRSIELGFPTLHILRKHLWTNGSAKPTLYSSHSFKKSYLAMWNTLNFAVSLRGIFRHWVGTVMPCWLWLTFGRIVQLLNSLCISQTTQVVTELHKLQNDTQIGLSNF